MQNNIITYNELHQIMYKDVYKMTLEELIKKHKELCDLYFDDGDDELVNCGSYFISVGLDLCMDEGLKDDIKDGFLKSEYLSNYIKTSIKEVLDKKDVCDKRTEVLSSNKLINDMTEDELDKIYSVMKDNKVSTCTLLNLLYRLDGEGVKSFITRPVFWEDLSTYVLESSGLNSRASFYSGRGVNIGDLNADKLLRMYRKLYRINIDYAVDFYDLVEMIPTLGATEFITSFQLFARNGFSINNIEPSSNNYSLDGLHGSIRDNAAIFNVFMAFGSPRNEGYERSLSNDIKRDFKGSTFFDVNIIKLRKKGNVSLRDVERLDEEYGILMNDPFDMDFRRL